MDNLVEEKHVSNEVAITTPLHEAKTRVPHPEGEKEDQGATDYLVKRLLGLPIELRTMIFEAIYAEGDVIKITDMTSYFQKQTGFLDRTCVDVHTAGEAAIALYHANTWALPLGLLGNFMTYDIYGSGTRPENWVTSLIIPLPETRSACKLTRSLWEDELGCSLGYEYDYVHGYNHQPGRERVRERSALLLQAKRLKKVKFRLERGCCGYLELRDIGPSIYSLKERGVQVRITADFCNICRDCNRLHQQDITEYFNEPTEEESEHIGDAVLRRFDENGIVFVTDPATDPRFYRVILQQHYNYYKLREIEKERHGPVNIMTSFEEDLSFPWEEFVGYTAEATP